jgi:hypothetical protein
MSVISQMRHGFENIIKFNVSLCSRFVYPMKDNGYGVMIRDLSGTPTIAQEAVRLSREQGSVPAKGETVTGLSTNESSFLEMYHDSQIKENELVVINGQGWKVGHVSELRCMGDVYGKHAPLYRADVSSDKEITELLIGDEEGVITGTSISVEVPAGTDITSLEPSITYTGVLISPTGAQDFTEPVEYEVTAQDMSKQIYTVTVEVSE